MTFLSYHLGSQPLIIGYGGGKGKSEGPNYVSYEGILPVTKHKEEGMIRKTLSVFIGHPVLLLQYYFMCMGLSVCVSITCMQLLPEARRRHWIFWNGRCDPSCGFWEQIWELLPGHQVFLPLSHLSNLCLTTYIQGLGNTKSLSQVDSGFGI